MANAQIVVTANTRQAEKALGRLNNSLGGIASTADYVATALAGLAVQQATRGIINATKAYEGFRTQLTTYLGSQQRANAEIERLSKLAKTLPQDVSEVTEAFVIFQRYGLDTSNASMVAFSNIAASNSKSLTQFAEAVADAMTGEFERLKEFGIKVTTENGKYTAMLGDQQLAVTNNTKDLVAAIRSAGEEGGKFGSVTVGPLTLAMSNLNGAVMEAQNAIGSQGFTQAVADALTQVTNLIDENPKLIQQIGRGLTKAFLYAKEAVIILGKNIDIVGYVLAAVFGIAITRAVLAFAGIILGPLVGAFGILAKILKTTALLAIRHPIIGGIALIVGGIEYFTGALSKLGETMLGLVGDDVLGDMKDDALALGNTIKNTVAGGFQYVSDIQDRVNAAEEEYYQKMLKINEAMSEQESMAANAEDAERNRLELAKARETLFTSLVDLESAKLELQSQSTQEQEYQRLLTEFEKKMKTELSGTEKDRLRTLAEQNIKMKQQVEIVKQATSLAKDMRSRTQEGLNAQLMMLEQSQQIYEDMYGKSLEAERTYQDERLRMIQEYEDRIQQSHLDRITRQLMAEKDLTKASLSEQDRKILQEMGQQDKKEKMVAKRIEFEKKSEFEKAQFVVDSAEESFKELGKHNKAAFEAYKAFAIAKAVMDTYASAQAAFASLAAIPVVGPALGVAAAAAAIAAGLARVASIRSQSYSGRALGGPVMGGQTYMVGERGPELFTPATTGSITRNNQLGGGGDVNVNFTIVANDTTGFDELLSSREDLIKGIISDAMEERGQRSMV